MIHQIKAMFIEGESKRAIARALGISRNTVDKYLNMASAEISIYQADRSRIKPLDECRAFIQDLLSKYAKLSSVKIARKLRAAYPNLNTSDRTIRRYVAELRKISCQAQERYYQPVTNIQPGQQCQVDGGELRGVLINGEETTVYFVVFVLSYSRLMYVAAQFTPVDTTDFIRMHDVALRYFGGVPMEMVYDQAKLVVLNEQYRELKLNNRFAEYATHAGFSIHACEGFDPESKGRVESGVKYVKGNALYGETFNSRQALLSYLSDWLDTVANQRWHGTTGQVPQQLFEREEQALLKPYQTPACMPAEHNWTSRKVDKTGLISWQSNKYSVPMAWQRQTVWVKVVGCELVIASVDEAKEMARHTLHQGKHHTITNNNHYRDPAEQIATLEADLHTLCKLPRLTDLLALIKQTSPKIYKDQLRGLRQVFKRHGIPNAAELDELLDRSRLTVTQLEARWLLMKKRAEHDLPPEVKTTTGQLGQYSKVPATGGCHV